MIYNDIDMSSRDYFRIIDIRGRGITEQELTTIRSSGSDIDHVSYRGRPKRFLEIDYEIRAGNKEDLRNKIDEVSSIIVTKEYVPVIFPDEPDRTYFCEYAGAEEDKEYHHIGIHKGTIILLRDKDKYGPEKTEEFTDDSFVIENKGTAESEPIFELTAKEKTTFAMISNGTDEDSNYNLIGIPTEVDEEVVDTRELLFEERGQTLGEWTEIGTVVDGEVSGELNTDNDGITVPSYGSGDKWHGPALLREIEPIQDFEVEMMLRMETRRSEQTVRIEMYLFDENMNNLGKMAIWDNNKSGNEKKGEARYGEKGDHWERYAISSRNYKYRNDMWFGMLRFTREGDRMKFYITRINTRNKHVKSIEESVRVDDELMGKLKYVQIHIGKYADTSNANAPRILSIKASELYEETVDQTPYIIYPGDLITFDHKDEEILINGENRKELKNFGGTFFPLYKGTNELLVYPNDTFRTKVKFRDKYL